MIGSVVLVGIRNKISKASLIKLQVWITGKIVDKYLQLTNVLT